MTSALPAPILYSPVASISDVCQVPHSSVFSVFKRCLDIVGSCVGLLALVFLLPWIALAIRLDSPGPIFYVQERHGLMGCLFRMYKFRSMVQDADYLKLQIHNEAKGLIFKNQDDPRVTRVGQFLRRTSLDEFPQFWNVLIGQMSLVGTRPPTPDEVNRYQPHHWQRLNVKPGMTGEWQVSGRSMVKDFEEIVSLDMRYQAQWTPFYDVTLIARTISVILLRQGAC
jgi:lipopolysaccharide/colanic/teichoic acid biosynthesis glycosyltransferase